MTKSAKNRNSKKAKTTRRAPRAVPFNMSSSDVDEVIKEAPGGSRTSVPATSTVWTPPAGATSERRPALPTGPPAREWAAVIFMKPDRTLEAAAVADVMEMRSIRKLTGTYVGVQVERTNDVERFQIENGEERPDRSPTPRPRTIGAAVRSFAKWVKGPFPAKYRMAVLWGHASGVGFDLAAPSLPKPGVDPFGAWEPAKRRLGAVAHRAPLPPDPADVRDVDDSSRLTIHALVESVREMRTPPPAGAGVKAQRWVEGEASAPPKLDILGLDSCYMSSAECGYELHEHVTYLVASESFMLNQGWNYREVLQAVARPGPTPPKGVAQAIVRHVNTLPGAASISMLTLSEMPNLVAAFGALVDALSARITDPVERRALKIVLSRVTFLKVRQYLDLRDLCHQLTQHFDGDVVEAAADVLAVLRSDLLYHRARGAALGRLNGVSIFYPFVRASVFQPQCDDVGEVDAVVAPADYRALRFVRETGWGDLLDRLYGD